MKILMQILFIIINNVIVFSLLILSFSFFYYTFTRKLKKSFNNKIFIVIDKIPQFFLKIINQKIYFVYKDLDMIALFLGLILLIIETIISNSLEYMYFRLFY